MCILVQVKLKHSRLNVFIMDSEQWFLSFAQRGWSSLLPKERTSATKGVLEGMGQVLQHG